MGSILTSWPWKMAWRDSRSSRGQLLLFATSIILGVAALVAISGFRANLKSALDSQAKALLGADLLLRGRQPLTGGAEALVESLGGIQAREVRFSSMVHFSGSGGSRLAQVRAGETTFPFYGTMEVEPPHAPARLGQGPFALVEDSLMDQFEARLGEVIRIGERSFRIAGRLKQMPGETLGSNLVGGRVYIPLAYLEETRLLTRGNTASYRVYFKFDDGVELQPLLQRVEPQLLKYNLRTETVAERKARLGRSLENATDFLNLVGFIALLLGGMGVASSIHVYVKRKAPAAALLRCLGARSEQTLTIYLCQALGLGLTGILGGILLGVGLQYFLPGILQDFLPVAVPVNLSWSGLVEAGLIGLSLAWLFSIQPLLFVRRLSPLAALRMDYEGGRQRFDWAQWLVRLAIVAAILTFALVHTRRWTHAVAFTLGLLISLALLATAARLSMVLIRKFFPGSWPYTWRQGLANLHRPHNQTLVLVLSIGFATFLMMLLYLVHQGLLGEILRAGGGDQPDMVLFDVQRDQKAELAGLLRGFGVPVLQEVPVVAMRLHSVRGKSVAQWLRDPGNTIPAWALRREYRSTYRGGLLENEELLRGRWPVGGNEGNRPPLVSLDEGIARRLEAGLGDELVFDVQGMLLGTRVGSIRRVNWRKVQPNFFVVFPPGVLEQAPQFHVLVTRTGAGPTAAAIQRAVVRRFPNVSVIDLALILGTIDDLLQKVSFVLRFMALFSIIAGLTVLVGVVGNSRYQRLRESALLRILGASRRQVFLILGVEYFCLASLAALGGVLLAWLGSWALARLVFQSPFVPAVLPSLGVFLLVTAMTVLVGVLASRGFAKLPPLEALRAGVDRL